MCKTEEIMVSVCCSTYNHEKYIADAIEGIIMQKTNFKFEILLHDDASTDKTADIIKHYEQKYPKVIKPIYQTVNQYSKGVKISPTFNYPRAKGKYIALCEGDDYWTDPQKLQIQFDCLESNPDIVCCYHNAYVFDDNGIITDSKLPFGQQKSHTSFEMMSGTSFILTLTAFFRFIDVLKDYPSEAKHVTNGDVFLFSILGQYGSGMYLPIIKPAAYRVHEGGIWSMKTEREKKAMQLNTWYWLSEYYKRLGKHPTVEQKYNSLSINLYISKLDKTQLMVILAKMCVPYRIGKNIKNSLQFFQNRKGALK